MRETTHVRRCGGRVLFSVNRSVCLVIVVLSATFARTPSAAAEAADGSSARAAEALALAEKVVDYQLATMAGGYVRSEEHTSELQSRENIVCRLLLEKKKRTKNC